MEFAINLLLMTPTRKLVGVFLFLPGCENLCKRADGGGIWNKIFW